MHPTLFHIPQTPLYGSDASKNLLGHLHEPQTFPRALGTVLGDQDTFCNLGILSHPMHFHRPKLLRALDPPRTPSCPKTIPQAPSIPFETVFEFAPREFRAYPQRSNVRRYSPFTLRTSQWTFERTPLGCSEISPTPLPSAPFCFLSVPWHPRLLSSLVCLPLVPPRALGPP